MQYAPNHELERWGTHKVPHLLYLASVRVAFCFVCCIVSIGIIPKVAQGANEPPNGKLGIGVFIGPGEDANGDGLEKTNRLWFALPPGASASRSIKVSSTSLITQTITLGTIAGARVNGGGLEQQPDREDPFRTWVTFSPSNFDLAPGKSIEVTMTITVPSDAGTSVNENYVFVKAQKTSKSTAQYRIPTAVQFVQPMMVSVGNAGDLNLNFSIIDVEGFKGDSGPSLRIYFDNTGGIPISLAGSTQLTSMDFDGVRSEKLSFLSGVILPSKSGYADVLVSDPVAAGKWRVFVSAYQGSTERSATFERDLTFDGPPRGANRPFSIDLIKFLFLVLALIFIFAGVRVLKSKQVADNPNSADDSLVQSTSSDLAVADDARVAREFFDRLTLLSTVVATKLSALRQSVKQLQSGEDSAGSHESPKGFDLSLNEVDKESDDKFSQVGDAAPGSVMESSIQFVADSRSSDPTSKETTSRSKDPSKVSANALRELKKLLDEGIISPDEFERKRKEILKRF